MKAYRPVLLTILFCASVVPGLTAQPTSSADRLRAWDDHVRLENASPFDSLDWRAVGPKQSGARVEAIAVPPGVHGTIYVGVGSGNLWKTENNGLTWRPIFEKESAFAIGDVAVSNSDPDIVWIGTGETQPRHSGYSYSGTGVFKSIDAGESWKHMGLSDTHHIGKVIIDPVNPDIVYVGAIGHFWSTNEQRGLFRTTDGGVTWEHVLSISDQTGVIDISMDPSDSSVLYASAWQTHSGGPSVSGVESGIYKTSDGGDTWSRLAGGLPPGPLGRIGLDVAPSDPNTVYAFIDNWELDESADPAVAAGGEIYRSRDQGASWTKMSSVDAREIYGQYGWKFGDIRVSPSDPNKLFVLGNRAYVSEDGGRTIERIGEQIIRMHDTRGLIMHLDHHDIWIDPWNSNRILLGNDGGLFQSYDSGQTWLHINNIPASEFYSISVDASTPYRIFGGTQDNAALYGPGNQRVTDATDDPWENVYLDRWTGGDSFDTYADPTDSLVVYYEHQHGAMRRMDLRKDSVLTGAAKSIRPRAPEGEENWRFGWYTPFIISHYDSKTLYAGGNRLFKSTNRGDDWTAISPDLADSAEGQRGIVPFGTITMVSESKLQRGLLYVGTEGGSVWLTRNDGIDWTKVSNGLPRKWVTRVLASEYDAGTVYAALSGYREDDFEAYVFVSTDFGSTWSAIHSNLPSESVNVIREDPRSRNILYLGTDAGVYVSLDRGLSWISICKNLPTTPVHDIAVHSRDDQLVIGTHGRSIFVLDLSSIRHR